MNDVTWLTIEKAEGLFFTSKAEIDALIEAGELDHKIESLEGRRVKLLMLHQLARHFDGRDTRTRVTSNDFKDIAKGVASKALYAGAGAAMVAAKDLFKDHDDSDPVDWNLDENEIDRILANLGELRTRCHGDGARYSLDGARTLLATIGETRFRFAQSTNLSTSVVNRFLAEQPLGWASFYRCLRALTALCLSMDNSVTVVTMEHQGNHSSPVSICLIEISHAKALKGQPSYNSPFSHFFVVLHDA